MSESIVNSEKNLENELSTLSQDIQKVTPPPKNKKDLEKFIPFTKKWRVKLYILNKEGQWIDKGIGYVFCANESEEEANIGGGKQNSGQLIKKLIMLEEKTEEIIFNLDIRKEGAEFHNQRGTIITWKKPNTIGEDNTAISFQEKEGVIEILKNIKIINGKNISVEELLKDDPNDINLDVTIENLPNLVRELGVNMEEQKLCDFIGCLSETNCEFIKKLGELLSQEEKKVEELKSSASFSSLDTDITLNSRKDGENENVKEVSEKVTVNSINKKTIVNNNSNKPYSNENINCIFNIFKNLILIADKDLLELLFDDECYLITFGALEHDSQSNKTVPHRKYFKEIVKFKNPLNIKDQSLLQKINQNLRLTYLRDTAFGRLIEDNTNRTINNMIQMNNNDIIQFFMSNKEYIDILFSQLKSEDVLIKKDAILFLSELISCSKTVIQNRVTFNEFICDNGILPILSDLIEDNPKEISKNDQNKELININAVEIFINILSNVPFLVSQYLIENEGHMLVKLTNLLLYHENFAVKYEVSQIFKTLIEGIGESYDKKLFFNSSIEAFISYLLTSFSTENENKNEISSTIQIIIEIFMAWINNMGFDFSFWLEKYQINSVIIKLLKEKNKIIVLYTIKLLKIILEDCEHYICIKILSNELCNLIINIFKENLKKNNLITSCLMSFFNSISQNDIYILNIIMNYSSEFFYSNRSIFSNIIKRYEGKPIPKRKLLGYLNINTLTETSYKAAEPIFHYETENYKQNENEDNFTLYNDDSLGKGEGDEEDDSELANISNDLFMVENNLNNGSSYLNRKRNLEKSAFVEEEGLDYGGVEPLNKRLNNFGGNYYKNCHNEKYKYKDYMYLGLKETEEEIYGNLDEDKDLF